MRNEEWLLTFYMNMRAERNECRKTERQSRKMPSQTVDNSKCHRQSTTHMTRLRDSPSQRNRERTISHAQRPAVDKLSHLPDSKQPKAAVLRYRPVFPVLPIN